MRKLSPNPEFLDLIFAKMEDDSLQLTTSQQIRFERLSDAYTHWLSNPMLPDNRIRDYIMARHSVTSRVAYQDIAIIKALYGRIPLANKEQMRHKANHLFDMATAAALAGDDKKAKALTKIAEGIVKNNRLEESDGEDFPWDDIIPKDISLSVDPAVIGIEPVPNIQEKAAKLLKRYTEDIDGPTQIDVIPDGD
jgi:hypothetical protein